VGSGLLGFGNLTRVQVSMRAEEGGLHITDRRKQHLM